MKLFAYFILLISSVSYGQNSDSALKHNYLIDDLRIGNILRINIQENSCFENTILRVSIYRNKKGYFANGVMEKVISYSEIKKSKKYFRSLKLENYQIDSIRKFEIHSRINDMQGSSTTSKIIAFSLGSRKVVYKTLVSSWDCIGELLLSVFNKRE